MFKLKQCFIKGAILAIASLAVMLICIGIGSKAGYASNDNALYNTDALRPRSAAQDEGRAEEAAKMFGYGFEGVPGLNLAHDKVFKTKAAVAFSEGRAIQLFGRKAIFDSLVDLSQAVDEFLEKSGEIGITKEEIVRRLLNAQKFLARVFDDEFIDTAIREIAKIDEAKVEADIAKKFASKKSLEFLRLIKAIAAIEEPNERIQKAREALVDNTRFVVFLFGEKGLDPYLFNVGNILSEEHRALVAHIGTYPYEGSENIAGGPRTIYTALARIEGFANRTEYGGVILYREMMLHEFMDMAQGRHIDPSAKTIVELNRINRDIDKEYSSITKQVATQVTEEGSVVVTTPKVSIEKFRLVTDLGKKDVFAIKGSGKVHPNVRKGSGQKITVTIAKADVGSIGGHGTAPGIMLEAVAEVWMKAAEQGYILDFFITRVGDDISVIVTHIKGKDNEGIHKLIWDGFVKGSVIAKDKGYYAAGQDLLVDAFSGNVRGAGPSVAEMEFPEAGAEVMIFAQADKTAPGAFNKGLWEILFSPNTTWRPLGKGQARDIRVGMLDFDYNHHQGRRIDWTKEDYDDAAWYLGFPDRYTIDNVTLGTGEDFASVTAQRLGIIAGEYVGKDDPMFMIRSQSAFPAVGEITAPFLKGEYIVPGWMRGSNKGPFLPVALQEAKIGIYDGPPLLSMWAFNLNNGRLEGFYDLFAANPAIRFIQDRRAARAVALLEEGFGPGSETSLRLGQEEIEYQAEPAKKEVRLKDRWQLFGAPKEGVAEQQAADATQETVAQQVARAKLDEARLTSLRQGWGDLAVVAERFSADVNPLLKEELFAKVSGLHTKEGGKVLPILLNHEYLLKKSPAGIMALQNIIEGLGAGNIKFVLHIVRDDIKPEEINTIVDEALEAINKINKGYTAISRETFAAIVVGTNPDEISKQVQAKFGTDIYQVIGPADYVKQFKAPTIRVVIDAAKEGQMESVSMAKALKLSLGLTAAEGELSAERLQELDELFSKDAEGNFHVKPADVVVEVETKAQEYNTAVQAAEIRV